MWMSLVTAHDCALPELEQSTRRGTIQIRKSRWRGPASGGIALAITLPWHLLSAASAASPPNFTRGL